MEIDEKVRKAWFDDFESKMTKETRTDILIPYNQLSMAFPNGTHSDYFDVFRLDSDAVQKWSADHGWSAKPAPENADPKHKNAPPIRFMKIVTG